MNRVVITGIGAISPFGYGVKHLQSGLFRGDSGLKYSDQLGFVCGKYLILYLVEVFFYNLRISIILIIHLTGEFFFTNMIMNKFVLINVLSRMRALAHGQQPSISCPFDSNRKGFVLSEGVGILFLERLEDALHRNVPILAEIIGYGKGVICINAP
uniref:beta-ketoacyl-[acyl-carrier-protein] synthase I n=1 Tax=Heterorhabditis bacteriophora TaxID=37862 RepID=A0A1I7X2P6_HETBA